jgi:hypothetical protein
MDSNNATRKSKNENSSQTFHMTTSIALILFASFVTGMRIAYDVLGALPSLRFFYLGTGNWGFGFLALAVAFSIASLFKNQRIRWLILAFASVAFALAAKTSITVIWLFIGFSLVLVIPMIIGLTLYLLHLLWQSLTWSSSNNIQSKAFQTLAMIILWIASVFLSLSDDPFHGYGYYGMLRVEEKSYHLISEHNYFGGGTLGNYLYECQYEYFLCTNIHELVIPIEAYPLRDLSLLYDESEGILQVEDEGEILYEHRIR